MRPTEFTILFATAYSNYDRVVSVKYTGPFPETAVSGIERFRELYAYYKTESLVSLDKFPGSSCPVNIYIHGQEKVNIGDGIRFLYMKYLDSKDHYQSYLENP